MLSRFIGKTTETRKRKSFKFMKTRFAIRLFWENLSSNFWFIPTILSIVVTIVHFFLIHADRTFRDEILQKIDFLWVGGIDGAREVLSTIATATISLTGVTFSVTIVALSLASSQFGPRILRNFLKDRGNQFVLGTFISTFVYSLLVLRTLSKVNEEFFVPLISVTVAIVISLVSVGTLVYFIHHISVSIQAPEVVTRAFQELETILQGIYAEKEFDEASKEAENRDYLDIKVFHNALQIHSKKSGYLRSIEADNLLALASESNLVLKIFVKTGKYLTSQDVLLEASPKENCSDEIQEVLRTHFVVGDTRTPFEDIEFAISQLVEVAVRALSPGINDPFTAIHCLDCLTNTMLQIMNRNNSPSILRDKQKQIRIYMPVIDFNSLLYSAYSPIRQYGSSSAMVLCKSAECLKKLNAFASLNIHKEAIQEEARRLAESIRQSPLIPADRLQCLSLLCEFQV